MESVVTVAVVTILGFLFRDGCGRGIRVYYLMYPVFPSVERVFMWSLLLLSMCLGSCTSC